MGHLKLLLDTYEQNNGISIPRKQYSAPTSGSYSNIGRDFDPLDFGLISFGCMVIGGQVACGGLQGTSEPLWRAVVRGLLNMRPMHVQPSCRYLTSTRTSRRTRCWPS